MNDAATPVIRLSMSREVAQGSQIIFETYLAQDEPRKSIDEMLDKLGAAISRQTAKAELPALEKRLREFEAAYTRGIEDIERIDAKYDQRVANATSQGRRTAPERTAAEKADREKAIASIERWKQEAKALHEAIEQHKAMLEEIG